MMQIDCVVFQLHCRISRIKVPLLSNDLSVRSQCDYLPSATCIAAFAQLVAVKIGAISVFWPIK